MLHITYYIYILYMDIYIYRGGEGGRDLEEYTDLVHSLGYI